LLIGLTTAVSIGFGFQSEAPLAVDEEQTGLDETIIIKFSHVVAENTPKGLAAQLFATLVEQKTNGKVKVEVFPNGGLYTDSSELDAFVNGEIQMIAPASSKLSSLIPEWQVLDLPYAFPNEEAVQQAFHGELGQRLFDLLENKHIKGMAFWDGGFKQVTSNIRPIIQPEDFQGQRFRIMPSKVIESQFERLGVITKMMPFNEVYSGLQTGQLDGQENTISNIYSKKFYTVQKYMTISNHGYIGYTVLMNGPFWNTLSPPIQDQIVEAMDEATNWLHQNALLVNQNQYKQIQKSPIEIHEQTPEEREKWLNMLEPVYASYESSVGSELITMLKKIQNDHK
jgi:tripartite ATP-independent transporter DctP family solute receptor